MYVARHAAASQHDGIRTQEGTFYRYEQNAARRYGRLRWQESDAGPPRKYYKLTDKGSRSSTNSATIGPTATTHDNWDEADHAESDQHQSERHVFQLEERGYEP